MIYLGSSLDGDDFLPLTPTESLNSASVILSFNHHDIVHTTVECGNVLNMVSMGSAQAVPILTQPPMSENASLNIYPQQFTYIYPRDFCQSHETPIEFSFSNFSNEYVQYYQYMLAYSGSNAEWITIGKMVNLVS